MLHVYSQPFCHWQSNFWRASKQANGMCFHHVWNFWDTSIMRFDFKWRWLWVKCKLWWKQESNLCTSTSCPNTFLNPLALKPLGHHFSLAKTFPILDSLSIPILTWIWQIVRSARGMKILLICN
jgi:hypothetical protein